MLINRHMYTIIICVGELLFLLLMVCLNLPTSLIWYYQFCNLILCNQMAPEIERVSVDVLRIRNKVVGGYWIANLGGQYNIMLIELWKLLW